LLLGILLEHRENQGPEGLREDLRETLRRLFKNLVDHDRQGVALEGLLQRAELVERAAEHSDVRLVRVAEVRTDLRREIVGRAALGLG